jgi:mannose-6-phosphate isomerase-like protein (cupin superfamily)
MSITFAQDASKNEVFNAVSQYIKDKGFTVVDADFTRPWGGFFVLDESQAEKFIAEYFPGYTKEQLMIGEKLSPKFLVVAPEKRLSWQYHFRRAEIWRVVKGPVKVATSTSDDEEKPELYEEGKIIVLQKGERHRLIGADGYGVVAEIWQHTDPAKPSDEEDIVRLQDDFGRGGL